MSPTAPRSDQGPFDQGSSNQGPSPRVWVLADSITGHTSQSLGVAEALGLPFDTRELCYGWLARIPGALGPSHSIGLTSASRARLAPPWPEVVIATGRRLAAVARWIKRQAAAEGATVFLVQMMDPVLGRDDFDLIAAPRHDELPPRPNAIATLGAPTRVFRERLVSDAALWQPRLAHLPAPRLAVLVGGTAGRRRFDEAMAADLGRYASALVRATGGSLMVTTSRRTDEGATEALVKAIDAPVYVHRWQPVGENPYYAFLGLCDGVIVTGESVSMASEACALGKPVYVFAPPALVKPAFARLHAELYARGLARPLDKNATFVADSGVPLDTAREIAVEIRKRLHLPLVAAPAAH